MSLKTFDARRVVTDIGTSRRCLTGDADFRITNAIEVQSIDIVIQYEMIEDVDRMRGSVGMTKVQPEVGAKPVALEGNCRASRSRIRKKSACEPVIWARYDRVCRRVVSAM